MTGSLGAGRYAVRIGNEVHRYTHWDQLPDTFDNLIEWVPDIPPEPHTEEQHGQIERLPALFREYLARETNARRDPDR